MFMKALWTVWWVAFYWILYHTGINMCFNNLLDLTSDHVIQDIYINNVNVLKDLNTLLPCNINVNNSGSFPFDIPHTSDRVYDRSALFTIRDAVKESIRIKPDLFLNLKRLGIGKKRHRQREKRGGVRHKFKFTRCIIPYNLKKIQRDDSCPVLTNSNFKIGVINTRSLKNKVELIQDYIETSKLPLLLVTESWINETDEDQVWMKSCSLNANGFSIINRGRPTGRGGGIAAIYDDSVKVSVKADGFRETFQYVTFVVKTKSVTFNILVIYRPPDSSINQFSEDFFELLDDVTAEQSNTVICGDFNIQVNDKDSQSIEQYLYAITAMGYKQHVKFFTHRNGNILDHVYTDALFSRLDAILTGPFLSDDRALEINFLMKKNNYPTKTIRSRDIKGIDSDMFKSDLVKELGTLPNLSNNLEDYVVAFENKLRSILDAHAPEREKTVVLRPQNMWYTEEIAEKRRIVRCRERLWLRYKTEDLWKAFRAEKTTYYI